MCSRNRHPKLGGLDLHSLWMLLATAFFALATLTFFDTRWAPLGAGTQPTFSVAAAIGFGIAVRSWWAPLAALALPISLLMLDPDVIGDGLSSSGVGIDYEWGFYILFVPFLIAIAGILIAFGVALRRVGERRPGVGRFTVPGAWLALGIVAAASVYSQARTRLPVDVEPDEPLRVDERAGALGGVAVGDSPQRIAPVFGRATVGDDPNEMNEDHPRGFAGPQFLPGELRYYRYPRLTVLVKGEKVWGFVVTRPDAETAHGIGIGDSLRLAAERYPSLECRRESFHDGGDTGDPYCTGRLGSRSIALFGGNPINSIVIARGHVG